MRYFKRKTQHKSVPIRDASHWAARDLGLKRKAKKALTPAERKALLEEKEQRAVATEVVKTLAGDPLLHARFSVECRVCKNRVEANGHTRVRRRYIVEAKQHELPHDPANCRTRIEVEER